MCCWGKQKWKLGGQVGIYFYNPDGDGDLDQVGSEKQRREKT